MVNLIECGTNGFIRRVKNKKLYCFGAGKRLQIFLNNFDGIMVESIIDNYCYTEKKSILVHGKPVGIISAEMFANVCDKNSAVVITCGAIEEILKQLDSMPECEGIDCYIESWISTQTEHNEIHIENRPSKPVIPKKIHYCWFGGKEIPTEYQIYMETWKKYCPDYEIIRWDESNYDVHKNRYVREAFEQQKWAFVSDYARTDILYHEGGIYFDTDVELTASFDEFLVWDLFCGFEKGDHVAWGLGVGAVKGHPILRSILDVYESMCFVQADGSLNLKTCPVVQSEVMESYGVEMNGQFQSRNGVAVYPREFFAPYPYSRFPGGTTAYTHSIHHYAASWEDEEMVAKWNANRERDRKIVEQHV